jgi:hypothetical protein
MKAFMHAGVTPCLHLQEPQVQVSVQGEWGLQYCHLLWGNEGSGGMCVSEMGETDIDKKPRGEGQV